MSGWKLRLFPMCVWNCLCEESWGVNGLWMARARAGCGSGIVSGGDYWRCRRVFDHQWGYFRGYIRGYIRDFDAVIARYRKHHSNSGLFHRHFTGRKLFNN
ncbi:hypothetical protein BX661DRAFT_179822 [Kickxella alabastrina]|uniref:uncharacterized protein n=1 Tax=Kickxella alabastrina TaxID=61397 RepID=UPI00222053D3|nr:uncharacterized protein BX661DRAFT_179822 [Kickxella alabastrina]KAI7832112.1 hypothetical protein BX661DRAFT_179822 [Kickxella alabastrina]